jgi:hypothetical protein
LKGFGLVKMIKQINVFDRYIITNTDIDHFLLISRIGLANLTTDIEKADIFSSFTEAKTVLDCYYSYCISKRLSIYRIKISYGIGERILNE